MSTFERVKAFMRREITPNRYVEGAVTAFLGCVILFAAAMGVHLGGYQARPLIGAGCGVAFFVAAGSIGANRPWGYLLKGLAELVLAALFLSTRSYILSAVIIYYAYCNWQQYTRLRLNSDSVS